MKKLCVYVLYAMSVLLLFYGLIGAVCAMIPNVETSLTGFQTVLFLIGGVATYGFAIIVEAAAKYLDR